MNKKLLIVFGTRPEAIKMAPVIVELKKHSNCEVKVCFTGQHREMVEQVMNIFNLKADFNLDVMKKQQSLTDITTAVLHGMNKIFDEYQPDVLLVQGDTTTVLAAALAAFYRKIAVAHVEAGLRTYDRYSPFPEEMNRVLTTQLSSYHFAPTELSRQNLLRENVDDNKIFVTGNTVIDALLSAEKSLLQDPDKITKLDEEFSFLDKSKKLILVTGHRRENHGDGIINICYALKSIVQRGDVEILYPVHPNPNIRTPVEKIIGDIPGIHLCNPFDYLTFLYIMRRSFLIMSDSGGVQEEAPSLGKVVLVMRESTERPEALAAGTIRLVGSDPLLMQKEVAILLDNPAEYQRRCNISNPFGDGHAAEKIANILLS